MLMATTFDLDSCLHGAHGASTEGDCEEDTDNYDYNSEREIPYASAVGFPSHRVKSKFAAYRR